MQFDRAKLKAAILHTCWECDPSQLGIVKLHKVLYYTDMLHYALSGAPVTGAIYRKRQFGPTCDALLPMLAELEKQGALSTRDVDYFGYLKKEFDPIERPDLERLSGTELSLLNDVVDFVCRNNTAKTISEFSHGIPWEIAEFGDVLPYYNALHLFPNQVSLETMEWAAGEVEAVEAERSQDDPLDYPDFAAFRSRVLQARGT